MNILNKEKILEQARAFIEEGKLDKAIKEYEKILLADPSDLRVKLRVAELYTKRKQVSEAIKLYREVADNYSDEGFFLKAVTVYKNVLRLNPSLVDVNEHLAVLYEKMGLTSDAVRQYGILAATLDSKGQVEQALDIRRKIVELRPEDQTARIKLAEIFQREGKIEEAIDHYEELARQIEKSKGNKLKLAEFYEKILSHRPDKRDMFARLIHILYEIGEKKRALKWLELKPDFASTDPRLLKIHAEIYTSQNQNESARKEYLKLVKLLENSGDKEGAIDVYCEILVALPDEDERIREDVESLRAGAMEEIIEKAKKRRQELEIESETKNAEKAEPKKESATLPTVAAKTIPQKEKQIVEPVVSKPVVKPEAPTTILDAKKQKEADGAFNLAKAYKKMGLTREAVSEFEKAKNIYLEIIENSGENDQLRDQLEAIDSELGVKPAKRETSLPKPKESTAKQVVTSSNKKPQANVNSGKKKVSFV